MTNLTKIAAALTLALGFAATPSLAQTFDGGASGYHDDGTLNVFGAHVDPRVPRGGGLLGIDDPADTLTTGSIGRDDRSISGRPGAVLDDPSY